MITREFNLYLHAGHSIPLVINVNQYDRGEQWLFTLFNADGTQYTPSSGAIVGIKSDNLGIINSGTVDSDGRVVINETQQMTAAVGKAVFELVIDDGTHGTANFVVLVEPKPGDNADLSESDISMIEEAVEAAANIKPYGSPLVASTVAGMTDETKVYVYTGSETGYTSGHWYYYDGSDWADGGVYNSVAVQTDTTLAISGMAADAKKTGDEISDLKSQITRIGSGVPRDVKMAIDTLFQNVAFKNNDGYSTELDVIHAWVTNVNLLSISVVFDQGENVIHCNDSIDTLKQYLTVTANYDDGSSLPVTNYELIGDLKQMVNTITVSYGGKTATFSVTVVWEFAPTAFRNKGIEATVATGGVASAIKTNTNNARAIVDPVAYYMPEGVYNVSCPTAYYFGLMVFRDEGADPSFDTVDWSNSGENKTMWSGTAIRTITSGWQNETYTLTLTENSWMYPNFKKGSAGTSAFSSSDLETLLSDFTITKVEQS